MEAQPFPVAPPLIVWMSFRLAIPRRFALQQGPPPLRQPVPVCGTVVLPVEGFPSNGHECLNWLSHARGQAQTTTRTLTTNAFSCANSVNVRCQGQSEREPPGRCKRGPLWAFPRAGRCAGWGRLERSPARPEAERLGRSGSRSQPAGAIPPGRRATWPCRSRASACWSSAGSCRRSSPGCGRGG